MAYYVLIGCDSQKSPECRDDEPPEGATLREAKREAKLAGWRVGPGQRDAICPACLALLTPDQGAGA